MAKAVDTERLREAFERTEPHLEVANFYEEEATRCLDGGGFLGAIAFQAAALEVLLRAMVDVFEPEVREADCWIGSGRPKKWRFVELIEAGQGMGWLPDVPAPVGPETKGEPVATITATVDALRDTRDMIHGDRVIRKGFDLERFRENGQTHYRIALQLYRAAMARFRDAHAELIRSLGS